MKKIYVSNLLYLPLLIIGLLMVILPQLIIDAFNFTIALLFMFNGIKYLVSEYYLKKRITRYNQIMLGIVNIVIGLIIMLTDMSLVNILPFLIALGFLSYSANCLMYLLKTSDFKSYSSLRKIILGTFSLIISLLLFYNPDAFSRILVQILGLGILLLIVSINLELFKLSKVPYVKRIKRQKK